MDFPFLTFPVNTLKCRLVVKEPLKYFFFFFFTIVINGNLRFSDTDR